MKGDIVILCWDNECKLDGPRKPGGVVALAVSYNCFLTFHLCFTPLLSSPLEKEMANHSSILAWKIPWMGEPGRP